MRFEARALSSSDGGWVAGGFERSRRRTCKLSGRILPATTACASIAGMSDRPASCRMSAAASNTSRRAAARPSCFSVSSRTLSSCGCSRRALWPASARAVAELNCLRDSCSSNFAVLRCSPLHRAALSRSVWDSRSSRVYLLGCGGIATSSAAAAAVALGLCFKGVASRTTLSTSPDTTDTISAQSADPSSLVDASAVASIASRCIRSSTWRLTVVLASRMDAFFNRTSPSSTPWNASASTASAAALPCWSRRGARSRGAGTGAGAGALPLDPAAAAAAESDRLTAFNLRRSCSILMVELTSRSES